MHRRWWGSRSACAPGGYHTDGLLGIEGSLSPRLQEKVRHLAADVSFNKTHEHIYSLLSVALSGETIRVDCERQAAGIARRQTRATDSADPRAQLGSKPVLSPAGPETMIKGNAALAQRQSRGLINEKMVPPEGNLRMGTG
jgi:hypothetical protein